MFYSHVSVSEPETIFAKDWSHTNTVCRTMLPDFHLQREKCDFPAFYSTLSQVVIHKSNLFNKWRLHTRWWSCLKAEATVSSLEIDVYSIGHNLYSPCYLKPEKVAVQEVAMRETHNGRYCKIQIAWEVLPWSTSEQSNENMPTQMLNCSPLKLHDNVPEV